jgi:5-methylcytosine-specific restriction enzyme A
MFELGREYKRSRLLAFVGSKQGRSGIIWGPDQPNCVIVTSGGKHSQEAGYQDRRNADGTWEYFGQGKEGDQDPGRYANKLLTRGERSVLLFSTREPTAEEVRRRATRAKLYLFEGLFGARSWKRFVPTAGPRAGESLLLFHLVPAEGSYGLQLGNMVAAEDDLDMADESATLAQLRAVLKERGSFPEMGTLSERQYRIASARVRKYARLRACGSCECCNKPAPFLSITEEPFLEVHHIHRLADEGPDRPENVAALCPNCHREAHFGRNRDLFQENITRRILIKEQELGNQ